MARSSVWKYAFIRTSIFFLHLVAPFSIFYLLVSSLVDLPIRIPRILEVWLVLETVFYCAVYLPRNAYLQRVATHPTTASREDRRKLFWRCHRNIPDPDQYSHCGGAVITSEICGGFFFLSAWRRNGTQ
ncbi:hypothetical protein EDB81DRAFT_811802 [Dactylonectria macrodidyma]|uniref:Uncharacterized protein n=1 Tax=Dactylonectria macrodidyma TaxID=307937 RepID=A0A9P9DQC5_9HYPO|nr:hypothetical protein EDB81DRAFT_811802 [Dactylonectria macrodidyma]